MKTKEQKALAACVELVAAANEVNRLKSLIGDSLSACHAVFDASMSDEFPVAWKPHLEAAYAFETFDPTQYTDGERVYLDDAEQRAVLAACPHCLAAHNAIQERKQARKRLGNARRSITWIGKLA